VAETTPSRAYVRLPYLSKQRDAGAFRGPSSRMVPRRCYSPLWESAVTPMESCSGLWAPRGPELFKTNVRYTGASVGYQLSAALGTD
jgi:hypothetical protein